MNATDVTYLITVPVNNERQDKIFKWKAASASLMISQIAFTALAAGLFLSMISEQKNPNIYRIFAISVISALGGCGIPFALCNAVTRMFYLLNEQFHVQKQGVNEELEFLLKHKIANNSIGHSFLITQIGCSMLTFCSLFFGWYNWKETDYSPIGFPSFPLTLSACINVMIILKLTRNLQDNDFA